MSSLGVSKFKLFVDIPPIGNNSFGPAVNGVRPLLPDIGDDTVPDPVVVNRGFRRVESRHTPTFHGAAFNFDNFWDGRARFEFNGGSVQGASDPQAHIFVPDAGAPGTPLVGATNGMVRPDMDPLDPQFNEPVRIKFSSLASQSVGPPLSDFEMSFSGRNWAKIGKKMLQNNVTPLAYQLVSINDSVLGAFSNQNDLVGRPGLSIPYDDLIRLAFKNQYWEVANRHLNGAPGVDPFDGYVLTPANGTANNSNTNQFTQMEANLSFFFGLAVQAYESLTIPDDTPFDRFMDANPFAANGTGQPGEQAVLFPTLIPDLVDNGVLDGSAAPGQGVLTLVDGFGEEDLFGWDIFSGSNLTAALPMGNARSPDGFGSNPFARTARCMLCHLGPEQTDHSINIAHGLLKGDAEFEFPTPPSVPDPGVPGAPGTTFFPDGLLPAPEPPGPIASVAGLILAEEVGEGAQDIIEVEPRNFATFDDPLTPWDDRIVAQPAFFAFGDQGVYNVGLRPIIEDLGRGGNDAFGWSLSRAALALINIAGDGAGNLVVNPLLAFQPNDYPFENNLMANVDPYDLGATFEETGDALLFEGSAYGLQSINPGLERGPEDPLLPTYMWPWVGGGMPAGELHPQVDEMAVLAPNTLTPPNGGPAIEFPEVMFGADLHSGVFSPLFGLPTDPPNFGWGPRAPNNHSGVANNFGFPVHGTWPVANRVLREGAFKAPSLRNVEVTGPYFHTGSHLTLRQVVDFYLKGGDFPLTNAENRDPHVTDIDFQTFGFGPSLLALMGDVAPEGTFVNDFLLRGAFGDALPDTAFQYNYMPDLAHALTAEPLPPDVTLGGAREDALEDARNALVKFLIALTDPRVKYERGPFDYPELFVPIDGTAPENTGGRAQLLADSVEFSTPLPPPGNTAKFKRLPPVGAEGAATPLVNFLGVSSTPAPGPNNDHFDPNPPVAP